MIIYDDHIWWSSGSHLGVIWESSGGHLGDIWESFGIHLGAIWDPFGDIWEDGGWRGIWRPDLISCASLSNRMQKFHYNFNFTMCFWGYHQLWLHIYSKICSLAACRIPGIARGPFTKTVRTPLAKASLGNYLHPLTLPFYSVNFPPTPH